MEKDFEEGECSSDSDSIAGYTLIERPVVEKKFENRKDLIDDSDNDDVPGICADDSDSDTDCPVSNKKRSKVGLWARRDAIVPEENGNETFKMMAAAFQAERSKKKKNNIWGSIIQEESLNSTLSGIGVKRSLADLGSDRGAETYDFTIPIEEAAKERKKRTEELKLKTSAADEMTEYWNQNCESAEKDAEDKMDHEQSQSEQTPNENEDQRRRGTKRSAKDRLGHKRIVMDSYCGQKLALPGQPKQLLDISEEDLLEKSDDDFALLLAERLGEEKPKLIETLVAEFGKTVAHKLYKLTQKCEQEGGMEINNGARRRTSGGVFLWLFKTDPSIGIDLQLVKKFLADTRKEDERKILEAKKRKKEKNFDKEMKDFLELRKEIEDKNSEKKKEDTVMDDDDQAINSFTKIITSLSGKKPELPAVDRLKSFQEPEAPPNSVERVERTLHEYEDDLFSLDDNFEL